MEALRLLSPEDKEKVLKYRFYHDSVRSLLGRLQILRLLAVVMKIDPSSISIEKTKKGKPYVANPEACPDPALRGMQFNISHHGDWVILAAESHFSVGCDVMNIDRRRGGTETFFRHMKSNFSEGEWAEVQSEAGGVRGKMTRFMRLWTLKEAYVKALGMGLSLEPKRVCFSSMKGQDEGCYKREEGASEEERERWRLDSFLNESKRDPLDEKRRVEAEKKELLEGINHGGSAPVLFSPWLNAQVSVDQKPVLVGSEIKGLASSTPSHRFAAGAFDTNTIWTVAVGIDGKLFPPGVKPNEIMSAQEASLATSFQILDVRACIGELTSLWKARS